MKLRNSIYKEITEAFNKLYESDEEYDTLTDLADNCRIVFEYNYYIRAKDIDESDAILELRDMLINELFEAKNSREKRKAFLEYGYHKPIKN